MAADTECVVYDIDYRKSPEHPFPAPSLNVEDVLAYLGAQPDRFHLDNIFLSGFSAGATLALSTSALLGPEQIKGVINIYALLDFTKRYAAPEKRHLSGTGLPNWLYDRFEDAYVIPGQSRDDPRLSPTFAPLDRFPKHVYTSCGDGDTLYQSNVDWMQRLHEAGHQGATFERIKHEGNGFDRMTKKGSESGAKKDRMYAAAVELINWAVKL